MIQIRWPLTNCPLLNEHVTQSFLLQLDRIIGTTGTTLRFAPRFQTPRTSLCRTVETDSRAGFQFRKQCL
jgi:hypothetical protein